MRKINPISHAQSIIYITDIINSKQEPRKTQLLSLKDKIEVACLSYFANKSSLQSVLENPLFQANKDLLLHCYDHRTSSSEELHKSITALSNYCPYCNIDRSTTVDHYLPKEIFPEYASYGSNLIPCCSVCNGKKGIKWKTSANKRIFLNVYFDGIPEEQFLFVELNIVNGVLCGKFYLTRPITLMDNDLWEIFLRHIENFNLEKRYQDDLNTLITEEIKNALDEKPGMPIEEIKGHLSWQVASKKSLGNNYWKTVVLKEIIARNEVLEYLRL